MPDLSIELEKKAYHLKTLSDISQEIFFLKEPKEILPKLLLMVMGSYGSLRGLVFLIDEEQAAVQYSNQRGADASLLVELSQLINSNGKFFTGINEPIHLNDGEDEVVGFVEGGEDFVAGHSDGLAVFVAAFDFDEAELAGLGDEGLDVVAATVGADVSWLEAQAALGFHDGLHGEGLDARGLAFFCSLLLDGIWVRCFRLA